MISIYLSFHIGLTPVLHASVGLSLVTTIQTEFYRNVNRQIFFGNKFLKFGIDTEKVMWKKVLEIKS